MLANIVAKTGFMQMFSNKQSRAANYFLTFSVPSLKQYDNTNL